MAIKRKTDTLEMGDVSITSEVLPFESSEDLLPDVMQIVSSVFDACAPAIASGKVTLDADVSTLLPVLGVLASQIGGGRLRRLAPRILAGTSVVMPDPAKPEDKIKLDLVKAEDRAMCFDARPDLYFPILWFAGKGTFARFFPGSALKGKKAPPATE